MAFKCFPIRQLAAVLVALLLGRPTSAMAADGGQSGVNLSNLVTRVTARFEVGGHLQLPAGAKPATLPMSVVGRFDYLERPVAASVTEANRRSIRHYTTSEATIKVDQKTTVSKLASDHNLVRAGAIDGKNSYSAVHGFLSRDERDLIDIPGNTLVLARLLPEAAAKQGSSVKPADSLMAALLGLDSVSRSEVEITLSAVSDGVGEVTISGPLDGAIGGVATEIELKGKLHYDVVHRQPFALALLIKEKRAAGHVSPGLDVVAKLELQIAPSKDARELTDSALAGIDPIGDKSEQPLAHHGTGGGFSLIYEPRWRITRDERDVLAMRLVDRGDLIAQCNVSILPKLDANQPFTLEDFQKQVQQSLGKHFTQFTTVAERKTAAELRMLHVVAVGGVSELPITWHYYLLIDETGRRAAISFTMETSLVEAFAGADQLIVDQFRFGGSKETAAQSGAGDNPFGKSATRPRIRITR